MFGIVVDAVSGYFHAQNVTEGNTIWPGMDYLDGVVKDPDGLILINSVARLFLESDAENFEALLALGLPEVQ
jgi:hypothetical protein